MPGRFLDSNVVLYQLDDDPSAQVKARIARSLLTEAPTISVQVLNEVLVNCRRKARMDWAEASEVANGLRALCHVVPLTEDVHALGQKLGARYRLQVYDAMIVAAAVNAGCDTLLSEDMQDGLVIDRVLTIQNPFA